MNTISQAEQALTAARQNLDAARANREAAEAQLVRAEAHRRAAASAVLADESAAKDLANAAVVTDAARRSAENVALVESLAAEAMARAEQDLVVARHAESSAHLRTHAAAFTSVAAQIDALATELGKLVLLADEHHSAAGRLAKSLGMDAAVWPLRSGPLDQALREHVAGIKRGGSPHFGGQASAIAAREVNRFTSAPHYRAE